jgi:hypothetical protein
MQGSTVCKIISIIRTLRCRSEKAKKWQVAMFDSDAVQKQTAPAHKIPSARFCRQMPNDRESAKSNHPWRNGCIKKPANARWEFCSRILPQPWDETRASEFDCRLRSSADRDLLRAAVSVHAENLEFDKNLSCRMRWPLLRVMQFEITFWFTNYYGTEIV